MGGKLKRGNIDGNSRKMSQLQNIKDEMHLPPNWHFQHPCNERCHIWGIKRKKYNPAMKSSNLKFNWTLRVSKICIENKNTNLLTALNSKCTHGRVKREDVKITLTVEHQVAPRKINTFVPYYLTPTLDFRQKIDKAYLIEYSTVPFLWIFSPMLLGKRPSWF